MAEGGSSGAWEEYFDADSGRPFYARAGAGEGASWERPRAHLEDAAALTAACHGIGAADAAAIELAIDAMLAGAAEARASADALDDAARTLCTVLRNGATRAHAEPKYASVRKANARLDRALRAFGGGGAPAEALLGAAGFAGALDEAAAELILRDPSSESSRARCHAAAERLGEAVQRREAGMRRAEASTGAGGGAGVRDVDACSRCSGRMETGQERLWSGRADAPKVRAASRQPRWARVPPTGSCVLGAEC